MTDDSNIIPNGPFQGKRIELAPTEGVDLFTEAGEEFMQRIFGLEPGSYLITDESSLADFVGVDKVELPDIQCKIADAYGVDILQKVYLFCRSFGQNDRHRHFTLRCNVPVRYKY